MVRAPSNLAILLYWHELTLFSAVAIGHEHSHDPNGHHPSSACSTHLARAFEQYSAYIEAARCICRNMLDRGYTTTCCNSRADSRPVAPEHSHREAATSSGAAYVKKIGHHHHHNGMKRRNKTSSEIAPAPEKGCCSGGEKRASVTQMDTDVEKGSGSERVNLSVHGMDCSGCGVKLERALRAIPGVSEPRVNFVAGNAEFFLDPSIASADEVIKNASKATGLRCNRLATNEQTIDLLASPGDAKAMEDLCIAGVSQIVPVDKKTVRLSYDPTVIGSRTLFERTQQFSKGLAPHVDPSVSTGKKVMYDKLIKTSLAAALTIPVVVMAWGDDLVQDKKAKAIASLVLGTFVQLIAVPDFYRPALSALIYSGAVEMDLLVVISITAAYVYSLVAFSFRMAGNPLDTSEFFETSTLLITLVLFGRLVAAYARVRAVAAVSFRSLQSAAAIVMVDGNEMGIDARLLQYGDKFKVLPHTIVPTDGIVVDGSSEVDESMLTGESAPVLKQPGDNMTAGTMNGSGAPIVLLTRLPGKNTVTDIAEMVEEAANSKPKLQDIADKVASWFVPVVGVIAAIVITVWLVVGVKGLRYGAGKSISNSITYAVATLAVSCPCALGLAVPMVLVIAGGIAARNGVVIKSAESTERSRKVTDVVCDKTGTITEGDLEVVEELYLTVEPGEAKSLCQALVTGSSHPVSLAVAKRLAAQSLSSIDIDDFHSVPGCGVKATYKGSELRAGNPRWTNTESFPFVSDFLETGMTLLVFTMNSAPLAIFGLRPNIRPEAASVISELTRRGITVHLASGDNARAVETVAGELRIPHVLFQCTPPEKRDYVKSLMDQGKVVLFVGDGTNDAVAVMQADIGVQMGGDLGGSDVTRSAADVVLLGGLEGIPFLLDISAVSFRRMAFNFVWSAVYNVLAILLASGAMVRVRIPPAYAGLGEIVSVLPVIVSALTMLFTRIRATA